MAQHHFDIKNINGSTTHNDENDRFERKGDRGIDKMGGDNKKKVRYRE